MKSPEVSEITVSVGKDEVIISKVIICHEELDEMIMALVAEALESLDFAVKVMFLSRM